jgi:hypothetical protein
MLEEKQHSLYHFPLQLMRDSLSLSSWKVISLAIAFSLSRFLIFAAGEDANFHRVAIFDGCG